MSEMKSWASDLEGYIKENEPDQAKKAESWQTAIGLQAVDGLSVSDYLLDTAKRHIEGDIDTYQARARIEAYYEERRERGIYEDETEEADLVSQRISELLGEQSFQFSPVTLLGIHGRLFDGIIRQAGKVRDYNITKKEWVLGGETVLYAAHDMVWASLKYDFEQEARFDYRDAMLRQVVSHIAEFTSGIWQIHPFCEGNTRTAAVFVIKYLNSMGFKVGNAAFRDNSWYFRNALVRANYNDYPRGIRATTEYLERFFENVLLGTHHELKNRYLHVDYGIEAKGVDVQSATSQVSKCKICTLDCTLEELVVLRELAAKPTMTQKQLAVSLGVSERTAKTRTVDLQNKGLLRRVGGRRNGTWEVPSEVQQVLCSGDS